MMFSQSDGNLYRRVATVAVRLDNKVWLDGGWAHQGPTSQRAWFSSFATIYACQSTLSLWEKKKGRQCSENMCDVFKDREKEMAIVRRLFLKMCIFCWTIFFTLPSLCSALASRDELERSIEPAHSWNLDELSIHQTLIASSINWVSE